MVESDPTSMPAAELAFWLGEELAEGVRGPGVPPLSLPTPGPLSGPDDQVETGYVEPLTLLNPDEIW